MTTATFKIAVHPRVSLRPRLLATIARALEAYAALRMQKVVSECEFRRAEREIETCSRLIDNGAAAHNI